MPEDYWATFVKDEEHSLGFLAEAVKYKHPDVIKQLKDVLENLIRLGLQDVRVGEILETLEKAEFPT